MRKRTILITGWLSLVAALVAMIIGHSGNHDLNWQTNHISTYAATAPHGLWITAGMVLPCLTFACISILISKYRVLGDNHLVHTAPLLAGAAVSGLLTLALFRETARTMSTLKDSSFDAIRQQSFHDAGLSIFFYSSISLAVLSGVHIFMQTKNRKRKILGALIALFGIAALPLMTMPWPQIFGIINAVPGLKQRASLLSLGLTGALLLLVAGLGPGPECASGKCSAVPRQ